jgi:hypothetical protein
MFSRSSATHVSPIRLSLLVVFLGSLAWLVFPSFRETPRDTNGLRSHSTREATQQEQLETEPSTTKLEGAAARAYLEKTADGQNLMRAVIAEQYGLKWQERAPDGVATGGGYLGTSHNENLNAWFDQEGVTVRPTLAERDRDRSWQLGFRLKGYGYGERLHDAPPIVKSEVKGNRIEYERTDCQLPIANCRFETSIATSIFGHPPASTTKLSILQSTIGNESTITEWYENGPQGIEQGFTINTRPERSEDTANEPLRLELALTGDLRSRISDDGKEIELVDKAGMSVLSYGKLSAVDAEGKKLVSRMEVSPDGREIELVVQDAGARYPLVIDPIVATLEQTLVANFFSPQTGAQFGWAVAIENDYAVVGAPTHDAQFVDGGVIFVFRRTGSSWNTVFATTVGGGLCGYSVAISGAKVVYGCPTGTGIASGDAANSGLAFLYDIPSGTSIQLKFHLTPFRHQSGDFYGGSVAINHEMVIVGAPSNSSGRSLRHCWGPRAATGSERA